MDVSKLNEADLIDACPYISILNNQKIDIDTLGYGLSLTFQGYGPVGMAKKDVNYMIHALPRDYWAEVKKEIYLLENILISWGQVLKYNKRFFMLRYGKAVAHRIPTGQSIT